MGNASTLADITRLWILGINNKTDFTGDYIYAQTLLGKGYSRQKVVAMLELAKKEGMK